MQYRLPVSAMVFLVQLVSELVNDDIERIVGALSAVQDIAPGKHDRSTVPRFAGGF